MPIFTGLTETFTRRSSRVYFSSPSTVPSSEALSQMTSSRSVKSWSSTDSMQRLRPRDSLRTARPIEIAGGVLAAPIGSGLEGRPTTAGVDRACQASPEELDDVPPDLRSQPPQGSEVNHDPEADCRCGAPSHADADRLERRASEQTGGRHHERCGGDSHQTPGHRSQRELHVRKDDYEHRNLDRDQLADHEAGRDPLDAPVDADHDSDRCQA